MAMSKMEQLRQFKIDKIDGLDGGTTKGAGSFGAVYEVAVDKIPRIAKRLHDILLTPDILASEKQGIREKFAEECWNLSQLNHPNVVEFIGVFFEGRKVSVASDLVLVMERLHTDLARFLDPEKHPNVPLSLKLSILRDVSTGLLYLHTREKPVGPLIHCDIKPDNILLTNDLQAKIADLGVSKLLKNYPQNLTIRTKCPGTLAYMPPEALCEHPRCGRFLDVFSFGHLALYTAIQQFPMVFDVTHDPKMTSAIRIGEVAILRRKKWIDMLPRGHCLKEVILQCLKDRTDERPVTQDLNCTMKALCVKWPKSLDDIVAVMENKTKAQLDDSTKCSKARCIKIKEDYETLTAENEKNTVYLKKTIEDLTEQLTTAKLMADMYKLDFEAERRDREVAHSKLADLEKILAREKDFKDSTVSYGELKKQKEKLAKDVERLQSDVLKYEEETYMLREEMRAKVSQVRQYKKENDRLKAQVEKCVSSMVTLTDEMETMRRKKKCKDPKKKLSASVLLDPSMAAEKRVEKMEKLCDHYQTENAELREKSSQLIDEVERLTKINSELKKLLKQDLYGGATRHEEAQASSAVSPTQDEYPSLGDKLSDRPQSLPSLENESQIAGTGEIHRGIPCQLQIPPGDGQPRTKPMSVPLRAVDPEQQRHRQPPNTTPLRAVDPEQRHRQPPNTTPLRAVDPEQRHRQPPNTTPLRTVDPEQQHRQQPHVSAPLGAGNLGTQHQQQPPITYAPLRARDPLLEQPRTVPAYAPKSPSPVAQKGSIAEAPTVQVVGPNQLGSPQHAPAQSQLKTPFNHPQDVHSYDHSRVQLNVPCAATTPGGGYGYNDKPHYGGEQPSGRFLSWDPHHQPPSPRVDPSYDLNKYADSAQLATHPPHSGTFQPVVTTSEPQYPTQSRSGDQPQHHRHSQPHSGKQTQPTGPPRHEATAKKERPEPGIQQKLAFDQPSLLPVAKMDVEDDDYQVDDEDFRFQNRVQDKVDDDIEREASEVMQQVSGGRRYIMTDRQRPFDPNLVCPICMKKFCIGEIQKFKHHVSTCDGTDGSII